MFSKIISLAFVGGALADCPAAFDKCNHLCNFQPEDAVYVFQSGAFSCPGCDMNQIFAWQNVTLDANKTSACVAMKYGSTEIKDAGYINLYIKMTCQSTTGAGGNFDCSGCSAEKPGLVWEEHTNADCTSPANTTLLAVAQSFESRDDPTPELTEAIKNRRHVPNYLYAEDLDKIWGSQQKCLRRDKDTVQKPGGAFQLIQKGTGAAKVINQLTCLAKYDWGFSAAGNSNPSSLVGDGSSASALSVAGIFVASVFAKFF